MSGNITATSSGDDSGIGSGSSSGGGASTVTNLAIMSGNITASSSEGHSGIGSGSSNDGGASTVKLLRFSGTVMLFCRGNFPINASSIILSNTSLTISTPLKCVVGENPFREGSLNLSIAYENATSAGLEQLWGLNSTVLQIGNVSLPDSNFWTFCISAIGYENCFDIKSTKVKSLLFSVPFQGSYSIRAFKEGSMGFIGTEACLWPFDVSSNFSFIPSAKFTVYSLPVPSNCPTRSHSPAMSDSLQLRSASNFSDSKGLDGLNSGVVIGIASGSAVIFLVLLGLVIFFCCRRKMKKKEESSSEPDEILDYLTELSA
jgi:hypothetical protein